MIRDSGLVDGDNVAVCTDGFPDASIPISPRPTIHAAYFHGRVAKSGLDPLSGISVIVACLTINQAA
jgi:hypothetical protein